MDPSSPSPPVCGRELCQFHGQCVMMNGEPFCKCLLGYRGAFCQDRVSQSIQVPLTLGVLGVLAGTILLAFACRFLWKRVKVLKRLWEFRRHQEPGRTRRDGSSCGSSPGDRQQLTTIRLGVLSNGQDTIYVPRPGTSIKKIMVPLSMPESAFIEKLRAEFPSLQGDFCLCKVDRNGGIHELDLSSVCPSALKACPVLRRSAVYIRPKENWEEEVRNMCEVEDGNEMENQEMSEDQFRLEEEGCDRLEEESITDQADEQTMESENVALLEWRVLRNQQDEEYEQSLVMDRLRERRRNQIQERELRRVQAINTRKERISSISEPENGMAFQFKYPDGGLKRRHFLPSQPFQDMVAFVGCEEMASEIFSLQEPMSPVSILSTQRGSLADNGLTAPCTLYILWMSGDAVEEIMSNSSMVHHQMAAAPPSPPSPPTTVPAFSPAPSPAHSPVYISSTPSSPNWKDIEEPFDIAAILKTLKSRVHHLAPAANQINVLRDEEFDSALRAFSRPAFDPEAKLDIVFIDEDGRGEGAIDDDGPTREFCRLLMRQLQGHLIFEGPEEARTLALDSVALHNTTYRTVGQMLSVCLIHGGVSPHFFSKRLFSQVFGQPAGPATIEEVVDHGLRTKLEKINSAETLDDARQAMNETAEELALMGALRHLQSLEQRKELMDAVLKFYCEGRIHAALQQFREGLGTLGVLEEGTSHPQAFEKVFLQDTTSLRASDIVGLFKASHRSLPGSNRRQLEARTICFWKDWLLEVEGGHAHPISLEQVLIFATGLQHIPAMGFQTQPKLDFLYPEDGLARFPKANTCSLVLHLPVGQSYTDFKNNMELGVGSAPYFGGA